MSINDGVRGPGVNVIRPHQKEFSASIFKEPFQRRFNLLVGERSRIEDVPRAFLAFVLDRIEEKVISGLENRQHGFAAGGSPAAEDGDNPILVDEFRGSGGKRWPVRLTIFFDRDHGQFLFADLESSGGVDFVDGKELRFGDGVLRNRHRSRARVEDADFDFPVKIETR